MNNIYNKATASVRQNRYEMVYALSATGEILSIAGCRTNKRQDVIDKMLAIPEVSTVEVYGGFGKITIKRAI